MYNIKNKVYVKHMSTFATHEGPFILIDDGRYEAMHFPDDINIIGRYDTLQQMLDMRYSGKIEKFWKFISKIDKLKIYTDNAYDELFICMLKELESEFEIESEDSKKIIELFEVNEFLIQNTDSNLIDNWNDSDYEVTGKLFDTSKVEEISIEYTSMLYNKYIDKDQANTKLSQISRLMIGTYISSMHNHVKKLIIHEPVILQNYFDDTNIISPVDIKNVIKNDEFLTQFLVHKEYDVYDSLDHIIKIFKATFKFESLTEDDHLEEFVKFVSLYKNPDMDEFKLWIPYLINFNFFTYKSEKFNTFMLKETL